MGFFGLLVLNSADKQESWLRKGQCCYCRAAEIGWPGVFSDDELKNLQQGMPMLEFKEVEYMSPIRLAASVLSAVTTVDLDGPTGLFKSQMLYGRIGIGGSNHSHC